MIRSLFRLASVAQVLTATRAAAPSWVYFGNAGMEPNSAIYGAAFNSDSGTLGEPVPAAPAWNPVCSTPTRSTISLRDKGHPAAEVPKPFCVIFVPRE